MRYAFFMMLALIILTGCSAARPMTFVLVPDTQTYSEKYPEILKSQIDWILENRGSIDFVLQQGDLTQNNSLEEWSIITDNFYRLNGVVPYTVAVGNHDMGSGPGKFADVRDTTLFNHAFPVRMLRDMPSFRESFPEGKSDNTYHIFSVGGRKWMVLSLEFGPRNKVLDWANNVVKRHPDATVILNTHAYMYSDDSRQGRGDYWRAQDYGIGQDSGEDAVNDGEQVWKKLVYPNDNIRFTVSGHVLNDGAGTLVSTNRSGKNVYQFLANFQEGVAGSENGGNGWLRIMRIWPKSGKVTVETYSPHLDLKKDDKKHNLVFRNFKW